MNKEEMTAYFKIELENNQNDYNELIKNRNEYNKKIKEIDEKKIRYEEKIFSIRKALDYLGVIT